MRQAELDQLVAAIYRCPGDQAAWGRLAHDINRGFWAQHVQLVVFDAGGPVATGVHTDTALALEYVRDYASRDLAAPRVLASPDSRAVFSHGLLSAEELACCPVHNELLPRLGIGSRTWVTTKNADRLISIGILHPRGSDGLDAHETHQLELVHGHLQQALHLHWTLTSAQAMRLSMAAGLDEVSTGVILLGETANVLFVNAAAQSRLTPNGLCIASGRLGAAKSADDAALRRLVDGATGRNGPVLGGALEFAGLHIRAVPADGARSVLHATAAAIVLVEALQPPGVRPDTLLSLGLTPAEAALAAALVDGETLDTYAQRTGRAPSTVRTQLRTVFEKTDTHRQSELILHLLGAARQR